MLEPRIGKRPVWLEVTEGGVRGRGWSDFVGLVLSAVGAVQHQSVVSKGMV